MSIATATTAPVVLIVGETALLRLPLVTLAHRFGYRPVEAGLGAEAPECYTERRAAGVLLALRRGDEAELATLRALTAAPIGARVVVIAPYARDTLVHAALQAGACAFLSQPAPEWRLVQALERVVAPPTRRISERIAAQLPAHLALPEHGIAAAPCLIEDLSLSGARCRVRERAAGAVLRAGTVGTLTVTLPDGTSVQTTSRVVRLVAADVIGLTFLHLAERDRARLEGYYRHASAARAAQEPAGTP